MFRQTSGDALFFFHTHSNSAHIHNTAFSLALSHNTVHPRLTFRHRACCWVIALLINVSPSQDNGRSFTVRFSRLAMRDIQWCNLLSALCVAWIPPEGHCFQGAGRPLIYQRTIFVCFQFAFHIH